MGLVVTCAGSNRRPMIRTRKERLPFKLRKRRKYQDLPRELDVAPSDAEFNGRISSGAPFNMMIWLGDMELS